MFSTFSQLLIPCLQVLGHVDQGDFLLLYAFPKLVMFAELDQGGRLGFQLDVLGSVLVDSQSLDEMTQTQLLDQLQVQLATAILVKAQEIERVVGRNLRKPGQDLVGSQGSRLIADIDGGLNCTCLDQARPELFRPSIPGSARGIDGGLRRFTELELDEQSLPVGERSHDGIPQRGKLVGCWPRNARKMNSHSPLGYEIARRILPKTQFLGQNKATRAR